ncbi:MAG: AraC family transcriptional regulator [Capsulimonadaceae bacterium]|nr:AraC family transcriptional regulator [Capsulimonadaceae bacterium]
MPTNIPIFSVPLGSRPVIEHITYGLHGPARSQSYCQPQQWCFQLYTYNAEFRVGNARIDVHPGHASLIPPNTSWQFTYPTQCMHLVAHFVFPDGAGEHRSIPVMQSLGDDFARIYQEFSRAMHIWITDRLGADVCLWNILLELSARHEETSILTHQQRLVQKAKTRIEDHLTEPISIAAIAEELGVSHNHLTRLFKEGTGGTVVDYIRTRRVARARQLLVTTDLPINMVAANVGIEDPRYFSRLIRAELGDTPRGIRRGTHGREREVARDAASG